MCWLTEPPRKAKIMAYFKVIVQQVLLIEADDTKQAKQVAKEQAPFVSWGSSDGTSCQSKDAVKIISVSKTKQKNEWS